jgi:thiol-disulfide isomerase/thioredoxin
MTCSCLRNYRLNQLVRILKCVLSFVLVFVAAEAVSVGAEKSSAQPVIHLANDGFLPGMLLDSVQPGVIRWQSRLFTEPLDFLPGGVATVQFPVVLPPPKPTGEYCIELAGGDAVYGDILQLSESSLILQASNVGLIHVNRATVHRIYRWKETALIYLGPNGLDGWNVAMPGISTGDIWTSDGGWPVTSTQNASLFGEFGLPARSAIEFELSWNDMPDFEFVLGPRNLRGVVDANEQQVGDNPIEDAFRFEVWDGELVVVGESERDADVATVTPIASGPGAVRVQLYLDQERQRLSIFSRSGKQIASVKLHSKKPLVRSGLRLTNRKGNIRLKHLRIAHWDGILPQDVQADKSRIHQTDGTIIYGQITAFDSKAKKFTVKSDASTTDVDAAMVSDVFLSPVVTEQISEKPPAGTDQLAIDATIPTKAVSTSRITCQDGSQFSGQLKGVQNGSALLTCRSIDEPLLLPLKEIRSISWQDAGKKTSFQPVTSGRDGRLEIDGLKLYGRLIDGSEKVDASCLVWHPDFSLNASPLAKDLSGRIVYRDSPKPKAATIAPVQNRQIVLQQLNQKPAIRGFGDVFMQMLTGKMAPALKPKLRSTQTLHLRSGDTIPCEVLSVDEEGLHFTTPLSDATFVPNDRIKGVELDGQTGSPTLDETKRERLLTLPRLQKGSPPTHLIYSANGDFLRGRLIGMTEQMLTVEVRLTNREIPRDRVAQIIWLHADELESAAGTESTDSDKGESAEIVVSENSGQKPAIRETRLTRIQTLVQNNDRLTFFASKLEGAILSGNSDILGECHSDLADIDQLLFGDYIEQAAAQLAYHRWKLHYATEPKFVLAGAVDSGGIPLTGTESPLVGQPAPDFKLSDLAGASFQLVDHRGEIIVLDFWATWCGPCLKTMPLVDEIVREFPDQKIRLIAVNMEEQPAEIKSTLERHGLNPSVVLDIDGVVAARYSVTSIPQTVIIDREGNVARLFVGGGPKIAEPLRQALEELTSSESPLPSSVSEDTNAQ